MIRKYYLLLLILVMLSFSLTPVGAQDRTVGLFVNEENAFEGYTMFAPMRYNVTYLINNDGLLVHSWESSLRPALSAYLLENGNLLRTGAGGFVQEISWDGSILWEFEEDSTLYNIHHDIARLPNGNVLMIANELKDYNQAIAAGRDPELLNSGELVPEIIIEVEPDLPSGGNIVWQWHIWDHLVQDFDSTKENYGVVGDHPELVDLNYDPRLGPAHGGSDMNHFNSIEYNEELDQILISSRVQSEIYIIDHSTTTEEAAGHTGGRYGKGGDLLYRWGNPEAYRAGPAEDRELFKQHDARWIESDLPGAGDILIFNNGNDRPEGAYSSIVQITTPIDSTGNYYLAPGSSYEPYDLSWSYIAEDPFDFYAPKFSGSQRLPNGNTLICNADYGEFSEVTTDTTIVWRYINPVTMAGPANQGDTIARGSNPSFRVHRYAPDYPGFDGHVLIPGDPIETYLSDISDDLTHKPNSISISANYPNPFNAKTVISYNLGETGFVLVEIFDILGQKIDTIFEGMLPAGEHQITWNAENQSSGIYFYRIQSGKYSESKKMVLLK